MSPTAGFVVLCVLSSLLLVITAAGDNPCTLPPETGPCRARFVRYHYDSRSRSCRRFIYGGCAGNANNFKTEKACLQRCSAKTCRYNGQTYDVGDSFPSSDGCNKCRCLANGRVACTRRACSPSNTCSLPPKTGPCRAHFTRYYYHSRSRSCRRFTYGGCRGNANNFKTVKACLQKCSSKKTCRYNGRTYNVGESFPSSDGCNKCRCLANGRVACTRRACSPSNTCSLPPKAGPCLARFVRYYYHSRSRSCRRFIYGGCRGNANNFKTKNDCLQQCR